MMNNGYSLPPRKARLCRLAGAVLLVLALWWGIVLVPAAAAAAAAAKFV